MVIKYVIIKRLNAITISALNFFTFIEICILNSTIFVEIVKF